MTAYYNDNDPFNAAWLAALIREGLIPDGHVDNRSVLDVPADDLAGYTQCHFFAGIGGWPLAARIVGWPNDRPLWTGSCPCQAFSSAARGRNVAADLWPAWRDLVTTVRPRAIFGEQVAGARSWFDGVCDDLENLGYTIGAAILPATALGFDHARPRLYFAGHANGNGQSKLPVDGKVARLSSHRDNTRSMAYSHGLPARMGRLRAYGNALVPQVAAAFMRAWMETRP